MDGNRGIIVIAGSSRFQEAQFQFMLTPEQATNIASNRDIRMGSKLDYLYQIQLRFCQLDTSAEQGDEFPPSICVQVSKHCYMIPMVMMIIRHHYFSG